MQAPENNCCYRTAITTDDTEGVAKDSAIAETGARGRPHPPEKLGRILSCPDLFVNPFGYTFLFVLELLIIIMVLTSILLTDIHFVRVLAIREVHKVQSRFLVESGIARAEYFLSGNEGQSILWESDGYTDSMPLYGKTTVKNKRYGLFSKITSSGTRIRTTCAMSAIAGRRLPEACRPVLTLHGKVGGLALMPGSTIQGEVVLNHGRICKGETTQEVKEKGLRVSLRESPTLPFDSSQAINVIQDLRRERIAACTVKTSMPMAAQLKSQTDTAYPAQTEIINGDCVIETGSYSNRSVIVAGTLTLAGNAKCFLCQFSAKKVVVEGGTTDRCIFFSERRTDIKKGTHNSQFLGCDSIMIGKEVSFGPMSLWMLWREGIKDSMAAIFIAPRSIVCGTIVCCSDSIARKRSRLPEVMFGKGCSFTGVCMTDGDISISDATVSGHLWVRSIITSDNKKGYINYLFRTVIREGNVPVVFPLLGSGTASIIVEQLATDYSIRKRVKNVSVIAKDSVTVLDSVKKAQ